MDQSLIAGIDIGGSHITVGMVNPRSRTLVSGSIVRKMVDSGGTADSIIDSWCKAIRMGCFSSNYSPANIGIAMPGPFDYNQGIAWMKQQQKFDALYGLNVKHLLSEALSYPDSKIFFSNDAACFLKGEIYHGAGTGFESVLGLTLGTGLGSSKHLNQVTTDASLWNFPFRNGIAEDYLSSRWFIARYKEISGIVVSNVKQMIELFEKGQAPEAAQVFTEFGETLAEFLLPILEENYTELVVIGGNISNAFDLFYPSLHNKLKKRINVSIIKSSLGEHATLVGAAGYCTGSGVVAHSSQ